MTASACTKCPQYSTTPWQAATSITHCNCVDRFIPTYRGMQVTGIRDNTTACKCDAGFSKEFRDSAENSDKLACIPCPSGMYKEKIDQPGTTTCVKCEQEGAKTVVAERHTDGATSASQCRCPNMRYMDAKKNNSDMDAEDRDGYITIRSRNPLTWICLPVPRHVDPKGTGIDYYPFREDLQLLPGHFRMTAMSLSIKRCPTEFGCAGSDGKRSDCALNAIDARYQGQNYTTLCHTGTLECKCAQYTSLCNEGHEGPYCETCSRGDSFNTTYYKAAGKCEPCTGNWWVGFAQLLGVCSAIFVLVTIALYLRRHMRIAQASCLLSCLPLLVCPPLHQLASALSPGDEG